MNKAKLLLITANPHSLRAKDAYIFAKNLLQNNHLEDVTVFFYGDGAYTANRLMWQSDVKNLNDLWADLKNQYNLDLPVCVSTALARGVCDDENAKRHHLDGENLHPAFRLTGLSELALKINDGTDVIQF